MFILAIHTGLEGLFWGNAMESDKHIRSDFRRVLHFFMQVSIAAKILQTPLRVVVVCLASFSEDSSSRVSRQL
jgi:hypothetical protein